MKYKTKLEQEFPALGKKQVEEDGFGHMVEDELEVDDKVPESEEKNIDPTTQTDQDNILKVNPEDFDYDETNDIMKPRNLEAFNQMVEKHPSVDKLKRDQKREEKVTNLKKKILATLKVKNRRERDLSCDSVRSGCSGWGLGGASSDREQSSERGETRHRSDDDENEPESKKIVKRSKSLLQPPKIVLSQ